MKPSKINVLYVEILLMKLKHLLTMTISQEK
nr:MAG TPA: hypothetical protein [Bacteriophage sp.]